MIAVGQVWQERSMENTEANRKKRQQKMVDELKDEINLMRQILRSSTQSIENIHESRIDTLCVPQVSTSESTLLLNDNEINTVAVEMNTLISAVVTVAPMALILNGTSDAVEPPKHLTSGEKKLLGELLIDPENIIGDGTISWIKLAQSFNRRADGVTVFIRDSGRLSNTYKKQKQIKTKKRGHDESLESDRLPSEADLVPVAIIDGRTGSVDMDIVDNVQISISSTLGPLHQIRRIESRASSSSSSSSSFHNNYDNNNTTTTTTDTTTSRNNDIAFTTRNDNLEDVEREFVLNYGKECLKRRIDINQTALWQAYRKEFPQWQREGIKLKNCWTNWKDGRAYQEFKKTL